MKIKINKSKLFTSAFLVFGYTAKAQVCTFSFSLGNDTSICQGLPIAINLTAPAGSTAYLWDNLTTVSTRQVNAYGTYYCKVTKNGVNAVTNGNFSTGNNGFTSSYTLGTVGSSTWGLVGNPSTYAITTNANTNASGQSVHSNFPSFGNHTPGGGNMMVVNGSSTPNTSVWCQNIVVSPNTNYSFSTWMATCAASGIAELAILQFSINGSVVGTPSSPSITPAVWSQFNAQWNSGTSTNATICIVNQNVNPSGNDFAIDDIFFQPICVFTDTIKVTSKPYPAAFSAGLNVDICSGSQALINANNGTGTAYTWSSIPPGFSSTALNFLVSPTDTTKYILTSDLNGCKDSDTTVVLVTPLPTPNAGIDDTICEGTLATVTGNAGGGSVFSWTSLPVGFTSSMLVNAVSPVLSTKYIITSSNASCVSTDTVEIVVNTSPQADFTVVPADSSCNSYSVSFLNNSTNANTYFWDLGDGELSSDPDLTHRYITQDIFQVKLIAKNSGCEDSKTMQLKIAFSENALFIPNSFTPNSDFRNDSFYIPKGCLQTVSVAVYDRWGQLAKRWDNLNGFWDGKINGIPAPAGVYVYLLDGFFLSGEKIRKKGTITLYR